MKSKTLIFATLLLATAFLLINVIVPPAARAGATWTDIHGPANGDAQALVYDTVHGILYGGSMSQGVWEYDGTNWTDTGGAVSKYSIWSLAYDAVHNLLYAGTYDNGIWKYDGASWTNTGGAVSSFSMINCVAYDPSHNLLYVGTERYGVWKYDGANWIDTRGPGYGTWASILSLTYDSGHNLLYAATDGGGVWKYDGKSWTDTGGVTDSGDPNISSLAYDADHNLLYASGWLEYVRGSVNGIWKYDGTNWTDIGGGLSNYEFSALACDSTHGVLYSGMSGGGIWRYDGTNWTNTGGGVSTFSVDSIAYDQAHSLLYAGTYGGGIWKYDGSTWTNIGGGFASDESIGCLICDSGHNILYANTDQKGVLKYDGGTWTNIGEGISSHTVLSLSYNPVFNLLYAGTDGVWTYGTYNPPVPPPGQWKSTSYFAEGYTGANFQEYATLENPNATVANTWVTFMYPDGTSWSQYYPLAPVSRLTVDINQLVGTVRELGMRVVSTSQGIVAERPMYFNYNGAWTGGSDAIGATSPNTNWYFAEGSTLANFDEYVTVLNPNTSTTHLTFHYMVEGQGEKVVTGSVGADSRATFKTRDQIGSNLNASLYLSSNQAVVAERPMYFNYQGLANDNWTGGHDVVGANSPNKNWYFAEGTTRNNSTDGAFEQWLCLQNPGTAPITVTATYRLAAGQGNPITKSYVVPAQQRLTVSVNREIGADKDDSIQLNSAGSFIAERPMYFNYHDEWTGGHDVLGANGPSKTWFFAEGTTRDNFNEWLCLQNPGSADAHATVTYYTASGQAINKSWTVTANSRLTVNVNQDVGANQDVSAKITSDNPVIVERPMYFNFNGWTGGHDVVGYTP